MKLKMKAWVGDRHGKQDTTKLQKKKLEERMKCERRKKEEQS